MHIIIMTIQILCFSNKLLESPTKTTYESLVKRQHSKNSSEFYIHVLLECSN